MPEKIIAGCYEVLGICGRGGTSRVYLVRRLPDGKRFAAKVMDPAVPFSDGQREAAILERIKDPAVPALEKWTLWDGQGVLLMECRTGKTLEQSVRENGRLNAWETVWLGVHLAALLQKMHRQVPPVFYLDLKPSNILLRDIGPGRSLEALVDFGCAREADAKGQLRASGVGTAGFAAPEQQQAGMPVTARADMYALAATLRYASGGCVSCSLLQKVLERASAEDPSMRFASMKALKWALFCCVPACFFQCFTGRKGVFLLLAAGTLGLAGKAAGQFTAYHWDRQVEECLTEDLDAERQSQLYHLLRHPLWTGKTVAETIPQDVPLCRKLGRKLWCLEDRITGKREGCMWFARGASSEEARAQYQQLEEYYGLLEAGDRPSSEKTGEAIAILVWMVSEEEDARVLEVTAKELFRGVYALPEEQLQTGQVSQWLDEVRRRVREKNLQKSVLETAEELLELSQMGRNAIE